MKILFVKGPEAFEPIELDESKVYCIGREPEKGQENIAMNSPALSRNHFLLSCNGGDWWIEDLKSFNGIRVNRKKILRARLSEGDQIEAGEYQFQFGENSPEEPEIETANETYAKPKELTATRKKYERAPVQEAAGASDAGSDKKINKLKLYWAQLDFKWKSMGALAVLGILLHSLVWIPFQAMVEKDLLREALEGGRLLTEQLGDEYRAFDEGSQALINCEAFALGSQSILQAFVVNRQRSVLCPTGQAAPMDSLLSQAQQSEQFTTNCHQRLDALAGESCWMVDPIHKRGARTELIGFSMIHFFPVRVGEALEAYDRYRWQSFFLVLLLMLIFGWLWNAQLKRRLDWLSSEVHLLFAGTLQNLEKLESFAAFDKLIDEVNRINSKSNQVLSQQDPGGHGGADFLQSLLEQVLLLEERAVMVVDRENQILAVSPSLPELIPLQEGYLGSHLMDGIGDTHLQGELVGFLNELSMGSDVLDQNLSLSDRVVSVRGMPIYQDGEQVASLLIF
ncbi:MAG: FHA domain-containing protein [Bradymonadales bacterium]|nr:MAG: FHA domain-containing protein [Bradymonadales bacterium]